VRKIILIRHARVDVLNDAPFNSDQLKAWVEQYDLADIDPTNLPPQSLIEEVANANIVLCSTLRRTRLSAEVLGLKVEEEDALFNEADVPTVKIPWVKLRPKSWLVILRLLLLFGLGKKDSGLNRAKADAQKATERLIALSKEHKLVVLVGHGGKNWLMKNIFLQKGWQLQGKTSTQNWGTMTLTTV